MWLLPTLHPARGRCPGNCEAANEPTDWLPIRTLSPGSPQCPAVVKPLVDALRDREADRAQERVVDHVFDAAADGGGRSAARRPWSRSAPCPHSAPLRGDEVDRALHRIGRDARPRRCCSSDRHARRGCRASRRARRIDACFTSSRRAIAVLQLLQAVAHLPHLDLRLPVPRLRARAGDGDDVAERTVGLAFDPAAGELRAELRCARPRPASRPDARSRRYCGIWSGKMPRSRCMANFSAGLKSSPR